jgi:hypothetical protein
MGSFVSSIIQGFVRYTNKSLIKNVIIISMCLLFVFIQVFYPYNFYASGQRNQKPFEVGIHYVYEQDNLTQIYGEVERIHDLGFKVIRILLECNPLNPVDTQNRKTDAFFSATDHFGLDVSLIVKNLDTTDKVNYYLDRWGSHLTYIQVLNEPELSSTWDAGAIFTDDEIMSKFDDMYSTVTAHNLPVKLYTNFGIGYIVRSNVPIETSQKLDFVGFDIFMDSFLEMSPHFIQNLHQITGKDVVITEFGMTTNNKSAQSDFIIKGLNLFKSMGLTGCWIVYWNSEFDDYGIRGTETETAVGEWIVQNAA